MTQYKNEVNKQRQILLAEKWGQEIDYHHYHNLPSMWYDTRPEDTENGKYVSDFIFHNGVIKRTLENGSIVWLGKKLNAEELLRSYSQCNK